MAVLISIGVCSNIFLRLRIKSHVIALKKNNEKEAFKIIREKPWVWRKDWFYLLIKKIILIDWFYFKNQSRNHHPIIRAFFMTSNVFIAALIVSNALPNIPLFKFIDSPFLSANKISYAYVVSIVGFYWNLRRDTNSKFDYCLKTYNQISLSNASEETKEFLKANLCMDILTMDLWAKRILSTFFSNTLGKAYRITTGHGYMPDNCCNIISDEEAYEILKRYALNIKPSNDPTIPYYKKL